MSGITCQDHLINYAAYAVDPVLSRYIDCVWMEQLSCHPDFLRRHHLIVPDNTIELIFTSHKIERRFSALSNDAMVCKSHVAGLKTRPQYLRVTGQVLLAVRFKPYGLYRFTDIPPSETINESIPTEYLFGSDITSLEEQLIATERPEDQVALISRFFTNRLARSKRSENALFEYVVRRILSAQGNVRVNELTKELNISVKTIERRFQECLGISPKQYCRLIRFFSSLKHPFDPGVQCIGELAHRHGYYDQMHFVKEVKAFTGLTPSVYFGMDKGIQRPIFST